MIPLYQNHPDLLPIAPDVDQALALLTDTFAFGGRLLLCGNGGSAADCDHIVGELCKGFMSLRPLSETDRTALAAQLPEGSADPDLSLLAGKLQGGLPALSLPSESALISAFSNDVDASLVYAQLVWAQGRPGDTLWCLSTSGNSRNVVLAAKAAKARHMKILGFCGAAPCRLDAVCDVVLHAPAQDTYRVQEYHLPLYHYLCAMLEQAFFAS